MYLNSKRLNDILRKKGEARAKIASIVENVVDDQRVEQDVWKSVYIATDQLTGGARYTRKGDLVLNVKPQRKREPSGLIVEQGEDDGDYSETW